MTALIDGQVVPALGQWQGIAFIVTTLVLASLLRRIRTKPLSRTLRAP
jgi:membrane protein implicated in regulation of membrane protease activity